MGKDRKGRASEVNREGDGDASEGERGKGVKKEKGRERGRDRSRERGRDKSRERGRDRSRERGRDKSRERGRNRSRERAQDRSRERDQDQKDPQNGDRGRRRKRSRETDTRKDEKEHQYESRHRSSRKEHPQSRERSSSVSEDENSQAKRRKVKPEESDAFTMEEGEMPKNSGDVSLSIEETNKLRASLGLKPLNTEDQPDDSKSTSNVTEEVHVPPINIGSVQVAQKLKDKMETMREKRRQHKQLSAIKTLGEAHEGESALQWVQKMRVLHEEKEKAEKRAKLLNEMDEEFGVGELVQDTIRQQKQQSYSSKDLKGLKVEHKVEQFPEERGIVLTLKDAGVLEETPDVLVSVNIIEAEKAAQNIELRKKKAGYNPYEEEEVEEFEKKSTILKKYDEEIEGVKKPVFELGDSGYVDTSEQREAEVVKQRLQAQALTLHQAPVQIASEYYTKHEMAQFRKPKKKKKIRRLKADDLLSLSAEGNREVYGHRDHGSRQGFKSDVSSAEGTLADEEVDPVIGSALQRTRLLVQGRPQISGAAKIAEMIHSLHETKQETQMHGSDIIEDAIVLDKTAEFCRQLGEEDESTAMHQKSADLESMEFQESSFQEALGGWTEVELNAPKSSQAKEEELYQEAEPVVSTGLSAALQMAMKKGFVDTEKKKKDPNKIVHIYGDEQRDREYERQKERERERDLSHSRSANFPEKKDYNPLINIEYVDDRGRTLTPKEAFRYMSHKFHGRGSGKKKTEKRMKKLQEEHFMNRSSSVDTPLNTLSMLQVKQKKSQTPYILLSGGSQSMLAPDLEKK